jgi:hypothetical protein
MAGRISFLWLSIFLFMSSQAFAVRLPEYYEKLAQEAQIKAIATIEQVQILKHGRHYTSKKISFKTEYALTDETPERFTATCKSVDTAKQEANVRIDGTKYFYPQQGERVLVKVKDDGSELIFMDTVTPEQEEAIKKAPENYR